MTLVTGNKKKKKKIYENFFFFFKSKKNEIFSVSRIKSVVQFFEERGHFVYIIVPRKDIEGNFFFIKKSLNLRIYFLENEYLSDLENKDNDQVFAPPTRKLAGKRIDCECDIFILHLAFRKNGIIVSNYDFKKVNFDGDRYKELIEERVLMYNFVHDEYVENN
jgi:ribonuclease ZC3H12